MSSIRINVFLPEAQYDFLKDSHNLNFSFDKLTISEHVRRAVDDYIQKLKKQILYQNATTSLSEKGGE